MYTEFWHSGIINLSLSYVCVLIRFVEAKQNTRQITYRYKTYWVNTPKLTSACGFVFYNLSGINKQQKRLL